jgi:phenylalanyl-tRNA synthetase alpha chain
MASDLISQVLNALDKNSPILSSDAFPNVPFAELKATVDRLSSRSMVEYKQLEREEAILEPEGKAIAETGSHEARVFAALSKAMKALSVQEIQEAVGDKNVAKFGQGGAMKNKWIKKVEGGKFEAAVCSCRLAYT